MGTRHLTMIKLDGELKLANYGQWDGYPTGQGATVAEFVKANLLTVKGRKAFAKKVATLRFATDAELEVVEKEWQVEGVEVKDPRFAQFNRDTGAEILALILAGKVHGNVVHDEREFLKDTLSCEFAWCVNLDTCNVEVHCGGYRKPDKVISFAEFAAMDMQVLQDELEPVRTKHFRAWQRDDDKRQAKALAEKEARRAATSKSLGVEGRTYRGFPLYKTYYGWYCHGIEMRNLADVKRGVSYRIPRKRGVQGCSIQEATYWVQAHNRRIDEEKARAKAERKAAKAAAKAGNHLRLVTG